MSMSWDRHEATIETRSLSPSSFGSTAIRDSVTRDVFEISNSNLNNRRNAFGCTDLAE